MTQTHSVKIQPKQALYELQLVKVYHKLQCTDKNVTTVDLSTTYDYVHTRVVCMFSYQGHGNTIYSHFCYGTTHKTHTRSAVVQIQQYCSSGESATTN